MSYENPRPTELPPVFLSSVHDLATKGAGSFNSTAPSSATWSITNRIIYVPFTLNVGVTVYRFFWLNGATVGTNNLQAGVYDTAFTRRISGTSTLSAGTANTLQFDNVTDAYLAAGRYYMALWCNGTIATVFRMTNIAPIPQGIYFETNAGGLPSTGTPADPAGSIAAIVPVFGLALRATDP